MRMLDPERDKAIGTLHAEQARGRFGRGHRSALSGTTHHDSALRRRGTTVLELLVAGAMLAALTTVCLKMLSAAAAQRLASEKRQTATREAANLMERLAAIPFDRLTPEGVADVSLSDEARRALPEAELDLRIDAPAKGLAVEPEAKRITVLLRWPDRTGRVLPPVRLVAWRFAGMDGSRKPITGSEP